MSNEKLMIGLIGSFTVKDIKPNHNQFQMSSDPSKIKHCHVFQLADDKGELYNCQVCDDYAEQRYCKVNDNIEIKIKSLNKQNGMYTFDFIKVITGQQLNPAFKNIDYQNTPGTMPNGNSIIQKNGIVAGKISSIALNAAIASYSSRPLTATGLVPTESNLPLTPDKLILPLAEKYYNWLLSKE